MFIFNFFSNTFLIFNFLRFWLCFLLQRLFYYGSEAIEWFILLNYCVNPFDFSLETYLDLVLTQKNRTKLSFIQCTVPRSPRSPRSSQSPWSPWSPWSSPPPRHPRHHAKRGGGVEKHFGKTNCRNGEKIGQITFLTPNFFFSFKTFPFSFLCFMIKG